MTGIVDLIDFSVIENQKENIQSLPGGRSAKALAAVYSPIPVNKNNNNTPSDTRTLNDLHRQAFEDEITSSQDSDDPLDVYDRYVKWTLEAYPSAQATESQLLPLLERATKAFLSSAQYKNDARYLKLWLSYIRFFSDSPRENFAFLARHNIGDGLALFYEEFAAWLESAKRWTQAEEVYKLGIEREARPQERLLRKFGEFTKRYEQQPRDGNGPSSPALPAVRPALVAKVDPFAAVMPINPQALTQNQGVSSASTGSSSKQKLAIFSDADNAEPPCAVPGEAAKGWENIGSLNQRRKENVVEARPWVGETLKSDTRKVAVPKMTIYKDEERIVVNLRSVYPCGADPTDEICFDELRAMRRGSSLSLLAKETGLVDQKKTKEAIPDRSRKLKAVEVKNETVTVQAKLESPTGPKIRRRASAEPTMTFHTKAATDEIYSIFNQPLAKPAPFGEDNESEAESDDEEEGDDYTSCGESTGTGHISTTSEVGDDEDERAESSEAKSVSEWSEFSARKHVPDFEEQTEALDNDRDETDTQIITDQTQDLTFDSQHEAGARVDEELLTPIEPESSTQTLTNFIPIAPEDYEAPTGPYKDAFKASQSRLPFMTPIAEKTESSIAPSTAYGEKDYFDSKTPSRATARTPQIPDIDEGSPTSPFKKIFDEAGPESISEKLAQPLLVPSTAISPHKKSSTITGVQLPAVQKPIIHEALCNPLDEGIRAQIFLALTPSLSSDPDFHQYHSTADPYETEIKRYVKATSKATRTSQPTLPAAPVLTFPAATSSFSDGPITLLKELGRGAFAPVYLVSTPGKSANSPSFLALKIESPSTYWEFYVLRVIQSRLLSSSDPSHNAAAVSILPATSLHLFSTASYLTLPYYPHGTLLSALNAFRIHSSQHPPASSPPPLGLPEPLALFFTIQLLQTLASLHSIGILHTDLKPDNILLRLPSTLPKSPYISSSTDLAWSNTGITLIDFGRAVDTTLYSPSTQFIADWPTGPTDCPEMRDARPWTWQADYFGAAGVVYCLLFGKYLETIPDTSSPAQSGMEGEENGIGQDEGLGLNSSVVEGLARRRQKLRDPLKRYWATEVWAPIFEVLLNPPLKAGKNGRWEPCLEELDEVRRGAEKWLCDFSERKGVGSEGLIGMLDRLAGLVSGK
ncbi:MAG: Mitotic spindle checkpoint component mad3 [Vezdaea aestivalis]|nr:MAG: Mitotic spindle checkpoint component mad3 [Vezdaea aestivalis]